MKKPIKLIHIVLFSLAALFIFVQPVHATVDSLYTVFPTKSNVSDLSKKWVVKFNMPLKAESVTKDTVKILDEYNLPINLNVNYDPTSYAVIVTPINPYLRGRTYTLLISQDVQSIRNSKISKPVKMVFSTMPEDRFIPTGQVNSYEDYYNEVKYALDTFESTLTLTVYNYDDFIYNLDVIDAILDKYPNMNYGYKGATSKITGYEGDPKKTVTINFSYAFDQSTMLSMRFQAEDKAKQIISEIIKPEMKDYEKEVALHDYITSHAQYDVNSYNFEKSGSTSLTSEIAAAAAMSHTDYGILVNGLGVCEGYAKAMFRLLNDVGIETLYVTGTASSDGRSENHAWNIVNIGGQYYHLDATWDDPVSSDGTNNATHNYFNLSDDQISKTHTWDRTKYYACRNTTYNFDNLGIPEYDSNGNQIIAIKSYSDFYNILKYTIENKKTIVSMKIIGYNSSTYNVSAAINSIVEHLNTASPFRYSTETYPGDPCYIKITFQNM